jgi:hypothetical protein
VARQVRGGLTMKTTIRDYNQFIINTLRDGEPMQLS